jgi:hypothetical protein
LNPSSQAPLLVATSPAELRQDLKRFNLVDVLADLADELDDHSTHDHDPDAPIRVIHLRYGHIPE